MSQSAEASLPTDQPAPSEDLHEQVAALVRLIALTDPQPWMNLDLTMPQFKVLLLLWHLRRARVGVLAEKLGVHLSTIGGILDRLVEAGFVCREDVAEDRRLVLGRLTPQGEAILARLYDGRAAELSERIARLSAEEIAALTTGLKALLAQW
jgi:DNA-binding MarR family transcriptional regulator